MTDWPAIRSDFEQGISQRSLALKYGISQPRISQKAKREGWIITPLIIPQEIIITDNTDDLLKIIAALLQKVAVYAQTDLEPKDIKLLADALSQFHKIKLTLPTETTSNQGIDWSIFTEQELDIIQPIFERAFARQLHNTKVS